jgi:hypothetical protein
VSRPTAADRPLAERLERLSIPAVVTAGRGPKYPVELWPTDPETPPGDRVERVRIAPITGGTNLALTLRGKTHAFDLARDQWTDGVLPGLNTPFPEVSVTGGWITDDEYRADVVSRRTPHRLELRAQVNGPTTVTGRLLGSPLPLRRLEVT